MTRPTLSALILVVFSTGFAAAGVPEEPTFTKDVLPILQQHCQTCHRPKPINMSGMVAPFALTSFEETRPWAKAIAAAVSARTMPPWFASEDFHGVFSNENSLSDDEIETIVRWVNQGGRQGDPADAPEPISFSSKEWWLGEPDLVVTLPEKVWVGDEVDDWQPTYVVTLTEEQLPEDRWIRSIEAQADSDAVHHIVVYGKNPHQELRSEASGRFGYGNIGGMAPGAVPALVKEGYGILLQKGSKLRISMHYHKEAGEGTGSWDQSRLGFFFYEKGADVRPLNIEPIGRTDFKIPANTKDHVVTSSYTFPRPIEILKMLPHMHYRGQAATYTAHYPDGVAEVLLDVPRYDYNWQLSYEYPEPKRLPAGTRVQVDMTFDNSDRNPANPNPEKPVGFGLKTDDEMAFGWMYYSWAEEAEETTGG